VRSRRGQQRRRPERRPGEDRRPDGGAEGRASPLRARTRRSQSRPSEGENFVACGLAASADVCADAAVLVVGGVPVALLGARDACRRAGLDRRADEADVGLALPGCDARGRFTDVRAVETDANHADQLRQVALAQAGVGAGGAAGTAIQTLLGTPKESVSKIAARQRVQLHDLPKSHLPERAGELAIRRHTRVQRDQRRSRCPH